MKEIEIKAHARKAEDIKKLFDSLYGEGKPVHKYDHYFRRPGASVQALRIREHKGIIELTTKKTSTSEAGEDNEEYEFQAPRLPMMPMWSFSLSISLVISLRLKSYCLLIRL